MRLLLINPSNPLVSMVHVRESRWNRFRVWKPLSLMVLAGLTPPDWEVRIVDENVGAPDYPSMPRPDLVGITAFTSQANRAYEVAAHFRSMGVPVVMGGIHATMCLEEATAQADAVVTGEADGIQMKADGRLALDRFPEDWNYYTLTFPVARYRQLSMFDIIGEMVACNRTFYALPRILRRTWDSLWRRRAPLISLVGNLSFRSNFRRDCRAYADFQRQLEYRNQASGA